MLAPLHLTSGSTLIRETRTATGTVSSESLTAKPLALETEPHLGLPESSQPRRLQGDSPFFSQNASFVAGTGSKTVKPAFGPLR